MENQGQTRRKLFVLGGVRVGKSTLVNRFVTGNFDPDIAPSIECINYAKNIEIGVNSCIELVILDAGGPWDCQMSDYMSLCECFLVCYSLSDVENTEKQLEELLEQIKGYHAEPFTRSWYQSRFIFWAS